MALTRSNSIELDTTKANFFFYDSNISCWTGTQVNDPGPHETLCLKVDKIVTQGNDLTICCSHALQICVTFHSLLV